jgi:hypothetical protein
MQNLSVMLELIYRSDIDRWLASEMMARRTKIAACKTVNEPLAGTKLISCATVNLGMRLEKCREGDNRKL